MNEDRSSGLRDGFMMGLNVAEYIHDIDRRPADDSTPKALEAVNEIARGELTLTRTDAETERDFAFVPESLRERAKALQRDSRSGSERERYQELLAALENPFG